MTSWDYHLTLDPRAGSPLFVQIAQSISEDVRRGRLKPGDPLPGTRVLADLLQVHRNTVVAAYEDLISQGWITTRKASGTFIAPTIPEVRATRFSPLSKNRTSVPQATAFSWHAAVEPPYRRAFAPGLLELASGVPDVRLLPVDELARALRRVMKLQGRRVLSYGDPQGHPALRVAIARMVSSLNQWKRYEPRRRALMQAQLERIAAKQGLSNDTYEIVARALGR